MRLRRSIGSASRQKVIPQQPGGAYGDRRVFVLLLLVAVAARLSVSGLAPDIDAAGFYLRRALELAGQANHSTVFSLYWIHPPGVSLVAFPAVAAGFGYLGAQVTIAALAATAVPAVWLIARSAGWSRWTGCLWALLVCLSPAYFFSGAQVLPDVVLVTTAIWTVWAVEQRRLLLAVVLCVTSAIVKEEALAFSMMGLIAVAVREGLDYRRLGRWLWPLVVSALCLCVWWVGVTGGHPKSGTQATIELGFILAQLSSPIASVKRLALVLWQAGALVGAGSGALVFVLGFWSFRRRTLPAKEWSQANATSLAALFVAFVLLLFHSVAGWAVLVRYQLPVSALMIAAGASMGGGREKGRVEVFVLAGFTLFAAAWLGWELRFLQARTVVVVRNGLECADELRPWSALATEPRGVWRVLTSRERVVSGAIYQDSRVLGRIAEVSESRRLAYGGRSAGLIATIDFAMGDRRILAREESDHQRALIGNNFTTAEARKEIARACDDGQITRVTRVQNGNSKAYIIEGLLVLPAAEALQQGNLR